MTNVQIAIRDRRCARALGRVLMNDGAHKVFILCQPNPAIAGVIVVDEATLTADPWLLEGSDSGRWVVLSKGPLANSLWVAGVRHMIQADCPTELARHVILAAEKGSNPNGVNRECEGAEEEVGAVRQRLQDNEVRKSIRDLSNALIQTVCNSGEITRAMDVLERSGRKVRIEVDVVLADCEPYSDDSMYDDGQEQRGSEELSIFDSVDRMFLQTMRVSAL